MEPRATPAWLTKPGFLAGLLSLLLFLVPLVPDVRLSRPKLLLLETGIYFLLFACAFHSLFVKKLKLRFSYILPPLLLYAAASLVFYFLSSDKPVALTELKRSLLSSCAFIVVSCLVSAQARNVVIYSMLGGSLLSFVYGVLQHSGGLWMIGVPKMDRVMSTFGNPIFFGVYIVTIIPVSAALFINSKRFFHIFLLAAALWALYLSKTRASFIALLFSAVVFILLNTGSAKKRIFLLAGMCVVFAGFSLYSKNIWFRQQEHLLIWRDTLMMWAHSPWIGTGPGTFHLYFPQFASAQLKAIWPQQQFIINDAHNEFIQYLAETGIIGFGIFIFLIFSFFKGALAVLNRNTGRDRVLVSGFIASAAGILVQNMFSVDMRFIVSSVYLFMIFGFIETFNNDYYELKIENTVLRNASVVALVALAIFAGQKILTPYIANRQISATSNFFDEKMLEPLKTVNELEKLAVQYPDKAVIFEKLGWVYSKEKNFERAIKNYNKAIELNPSSAGPYNNLGNIYFLLGDRDKAIALWQRSLAINPGQVDSRLNLAIAFYYNGQLKQASDEVKKVLEIDPKNSKALVLLKQMVE